MQRQIKIKNRKIRYAVRTSRKARHMRLEAYYDGRFVLTVPRGTHETLVRHFIREKTAWMLRQLRFFRNFEGGVFFKNDGRLYAKHKEEARKLVRRRLEYYTQIYRISPNQIRIKNHRTLWGSCSAKGNLNFSYKIVFLPKRVSDYVLVHELCHLREFNHSAQFWKLVSKTMPNFKNLEHELKTRY